MQHIRNPSTTVQLRVASLTFRLPRNTPHPIPSNTTTGRLKEAQRLFTARSKSYVSEDGEDNGMVADRGLGTIGSVASFREGVEPNEWMKLQSMLFDKYINVMLVFVPAAFIVTWAGCSATIVFIVNFLAMMVRAMLVCCCVKANGREQHMKQPCTRVQFCRCELLAI